jgi:Fe-Mn family superoxide dismutase
MITLPDLPYAYDALEPWIDAETMHLHHDKHHQTYVNNYNDAVTSVPELSGRSVEDVIRQPAKLPDNMRTKIVNNGGGVANHSFFWRIMGPAARSGQPSPALSDAITKEFGSLSDMKERITKAAIGRFGSGWAWLVVSGGKLEITDTGNQDSPLSSGKTPVLGVDVWEHAYYLKYQNRRADYLTAWWNVVDWQAVSAEFEKAVVGK